MPMEPRGDADVGAVCRGGRRRDDRVLVRQVAARIDVVSFVAEIGGVRSDEPIRAAGEMLAQLQIQIEGDTAGDVRRPIAPIEPV